MGEVMAEGNHEGRLFEMAWDAKHAIDDLEARIIRMEARESEWIAHYQGLAQQVKDLDHLVTRLFGLYEALLRELQVIFMFLGHQTGLHDLAALTFGGGDEGDNGPGRDEVGATGLDQ